MTSKDTDFASLMPQVAEIVLGEFMGKRNNHLSSSTEWRWGSHGSVSVDLSSGQWYDHEDQTGGGVLDLLRSFKGFEKPDALGWLQKQGLIKAKERPNGHAKGSHPHAPGPLDGRVPKWMDHKPVAIFEYQDDNGKLAYEVVKFPKEAPTRYMQRRPHPEGGWIWGLKEREYAKNRDGDWWKTKADKHYDRVETFPAAPRFLYRRAEVMAAIKAGKRIHLVEGEKDAETLRDWGLVATTNAGGAKYWQDSFDDELAGADIVICGDNDDASRQRTLLRGAGFKDKVKSVRVLDLALHWKEMPEKADVTDWKEKAGGTKEQFEILAKRAPVWKPEPPKSKYGGFTWDDIDAPGLEYDYLIDSFLTERGRSVIGGPSSSGKSFLAIHAAMCVARGQDFFQYPVKRGGVIYQAGEGGHGIKKRLKAYRQHFEVADDRDIPLVILPSKVDLFSPRGRYQGSDRRDQGVEAHALRAAPPDRHRHAGDGDDGSRRELRQGYVGGARQHCADRGGVRGSRLPRPPHECRRQEAARPHIDWRERRPGGAGHQ